MSSFTIHDLDPALDERLTLGAKRARTSKNRLVKELLARGLGMPDAGDDYREFIGMWSEEDTAAFLAGQGDNELVDHADWTK